MVDGYRSDLTGSSGGRVSGLIYPSLRQLCGFQKAACGGGVPRLDADPCHNDADSQASAQQPHRAAASTRSTYSLHVFPRTPLSAIWATWANQDQPWRRLAGSAARVHARPAAARLLGPRRPRRPAATLLPPDASFVLPVFSAPQASSLGTRPAPVRVQRVSGKSKQKVTIAFRVLRYLCAILGQSPLGGRGRSMQGNLPPCTQSATKEQILRPSDHHMGLDVIWPHAYSDNYRTRRAQGGKRGVGGGTRSAWFVRYWSPPLLDSSNTQPTLDRIHKPPSRPAEASTVSGVGRGRAHRSPSP